MDVYSKTFEVGDQTAFTPGYRHLAQVIWLAGTIVHDACHSNLHVEGREWYGKEGELACLVRQLDALYLIDGRRRLSFSVHIEGLIQGIDDPRLQWWNYPNRYW